ncbi:DUF4333 domain-containing protein [Mycobacteroides abscessus]|uniref:DUF4333 domain-containing protein n=1 Tax=Mycobacteroides abscessus TaxID=36809 RepID=UPI00311F3D6F
MRYTSAAATLFMSIMFAVSGCTVTSTWHAGRVTPESSSTPSVRQIPKEEAGRIAAERIQAQFGGKVESVVCEGPLDATIGATQRCVLTEEGQRAGVTLTVTKIEGGKVDFRIKIDDHPLPE